VQPAECDSVRKLIAADHTALPVVNGDKAMALPGALPSAAVTYRANLSGFRISPLGACCSRRNSY